MAESYSVKAILSAQDKNFSSVMKSCQGYANNLKTTLTGGLGFGAMAAIGGIVTPEIVGIAADAKGLTAAIMILSFNVVGMLVLSLVNIKISKRKDG